MPWLGKTTITVRWAAAATAAYYFAKGHACLTLYGGTVNHESDALKNCNKQKTDY